MNFTNHRMEVLNNANQLVEGFKKHAIELARIYVDLNQYDSSLHLDPEKIFAPNTEMWVENLDQFLNSTTETPLNICYRNSFAPFTRNIYIPADFILDEKR